MTKERRSKQGLGWTRVDLPSLELDDHDDGPYRADDDDEWPQELADASPDIRPLLKSKDEYMPPSTSTIRLKVAWFHRGTPATKQEKGFMYTRLTFESARMERAAATATPIPIPP